MWLHWVMPGSVEQATGRYGGQGQERKWGREAGVAEAFEEEERWGACVTEAGVEVRGKGRRSR